jgi:molybdenum cofactor guanylyltransferase
MIGVVLAGGASTRFGGKPKGLETLGKQPLVLHVANMLARFCAPVVIEAAARAGYEALGWRLIQAPAAHAGKGPLAGLAAGLAVMDERERMAHSDPRVAFAPCDMPKLDRAVYARLAEADAPGAYACTAKGAEPLVAILSVEMRPTLLDALSRAAIPRTQEILNAAGARAVMFDDPEPFTNVNTPDDLVCLQSAIPPEPSRMFFDFLGRLQTVQDKLAPNEALARSPRQARALLAILEPSMSEPLREVYQIACRHWDGVPQDRLLRAREGEVLQPMWHWGWRNVKGWPHAIDSQILALLFALLPDAAPVDPFETGETAASLARLGVPEEELMRAYSLANPELASS